MAELPNGKVRMQLEIGPEDADLIEALAKARSRARGARLKYLAKLGLLAEKGLLGVGVPSPTRSSAKGKKSAGSPTRGADGAKSGAAAKAEDPAPITAPVGAFDLLDSLGLDLSDED